MKKKQAVETKKTIERSVKMKKKQTEGTKKKSKKGGKKLKKQTLQKPKKQTPLIAEGTKELTVEETEELKAEIVKTVIHTKGWNSMLEMNIENSREFGWGVENIKSWKAEIEMSAAEAKEWMIKVLPLLEPKSFLEVFSDRPSNEIMTTRQSASSRPRLQRFLDLFRSEKPYLEAKRIQ